MPAKLPILLYHDLESSAYPNEKRDTATRDTVVDVQNFEQQIRYLAEHGYTTLSLKEYFDFRSQQAPLPPKHLILTFDDGHYSNYVLAFPILQKYGFRATFFIIADRVDRDEYHLSSNQLQEMTAHEMEIGSHGLTHSYLPLLNKSDVERELQESKQILETITRQPVEYFAFPGGHYQREMLSLLDAAGYAGACSCHQGLNSMTTNPYLLKRVEIRKRFSLDDFAHVFAPAHLAFYQTIDFWKALIKRTVGLERYTRLRSKLYKFYIFKR